MTIQDLKTNRSEIIARVNKEINPARAKEFMTYMANLVGSEISDSNTPMELFNEVMELDETFAKGYETPSQINARIGNYFDKKDAEMMATYSRKFA